MPPVLEGEKDNQVRSFLRRASCGTAPLGVLAFWCGMLMAARRYPLQYDWRYMPVSNLVSPEHNSPGYLWASAGIVLCSLCGLYWVAGVARRWDHEGLGHRPGGIRALQFGYSCMLCAVLLSRWLLRIHKGHEFFATLAFVGLLIGMVQLAFQTTERILLKRMRWSSGHARLYAVIAAGVAVLPILLAGLAQAYFYYVPTEFHWISFSWRVRGRPVVLRFQFWEWVTCVVLSAYMAVLPLVTQAVFAAQTAEEGRGKSAS